MPRTTDWAASDTYLDLVRQFPLRRLRSDAEHAAALRVITRISLRHQDSRDRGVLDYLDLLAEMIDQYEKAARHKVDTSHRTSADVVRHLMQANHLTITALARQIGIGQSNLSEMLSGRREFSKKAIAALCERFGVSPAVFF